jgi:hypothetical protein
MIEENAQSKIGAVHSSLSTFLEYAKIYTNIKLIDFRQIDNTTKENHLNHKEQLKYSDFLKLVSRSGFSSKIVEVSIGYH